MMYLEDSSASQGSEPLMNVIEKMSSKTLLKGLVNKNARPREFKANNVLNNLKKSSNKMSR